MKNITMAIDEDLLKKARKVAIDKNISLTGLIRNYLKQVIETEESLKNQTVGELRSIFENSKIEIGRKNFNRDKLHER